MSRIEELIAELAPNGVEFKTLGDVLRIKNGKDHKALPDGQIPVYGSGGIMRYVNVAAADGPSVLIPRKGSLGNVFYVEGPFWVVDTIFRTEIDASQVEPKFIYYQILTMRLSEMNQAGGVPSQTQSVLNSLRIPVPPLEIQREIVRILDQLNELKRALEAEIQTELEARRSQYEHYCQVILDRVDAEVVPISALGKWVGGVTPSTSNPLYWDEGSIPWLASMDVSDESTNDIRGRITDLALAETSLRVVPAPSVVVVMRSNILRRTLPIGLVKVDITVNQDIRALVPEPGVDAAYVYQTLRVSAEQIRRDCVRTDGSMAAVNSKAFFNWRIPLPSLEEQMVVSANLREFEQFMSDLSSRLSDELQKRRHQYEHYRDRLLTFRERAV